MIYHLQLANIKVPCFLQKIYEFNHMLPKTRQSNNITDISHTIVDLPLLDEKLHTLI